MKLIQALYGKGIIGEEVKNRLESAVKETGKTEEEVILENNIIPENSLFELKSKLLNIRPKKKPQF